MFKHNLLFAWRSIRKNKAFLVINLVGLSIGMAASVLILIWVKNELTFDSYHPSAKNIYVVGWTDNTNYLDGSVYSLAERLTQGTTVIKKATKFLSAKTDNHIFQSDHGLFTEENPVYIDETWFQMLSYNVKEGSTSAFDPAGNNIVISETIEKKYFGVEQAVGKSIFIDSAAFVIQAVVKDPPSNSSFPYTVFLPAEMHFKQNDKRKVEDNWGSFAWQTLILAQDGASPLLLQKKLEEMENEMQPQRRDRSILTKLDKLHFEPRITSPQGARGSFQVVLIFITLGFLLLLVCCFNYINFVTASAALRAKEISVKKINGAGRISLFGQFLLESLLTIVFATIITILLVRITLPWYNDFLDKQFNFSFTSGTTLLEILGIFCITAVLAGIYPSFLLSSFNPSHLLRKTSFFRIKGAVLRKGLVISQFVISISLITATLVIGGEMRFINREASQYNRKAIYAVQILSKDYTALSVAEKQNFVQVLKNELSGVPGVEIVSRASESIVSVNIAMAGIAAWPGKTGEFNPLVHVLGVDDAYKNMFNLQLRDGRWFSAGEENDKHNYVLNETAVNTFGLNEPVIGQTFSAFGDTGKIVGVVKDFHFRSLHEKISPLLITNRPDFGRTLLIRMNSGNPATTISGTEKVWKKYFPAQPFQYHFLDEQFNQLYKDELSTSTLMISFSVVAILLTAMGLFGLAAFTAEQRAKEIGIRKVLGATVFRLVSLLTREFLRLVIVASLIAVPLSWWAMHRWLEQFSYRIPLSWWIFLVAEAIVITITCLTISVKAISAARVNPVQGIRSE